MDQNFNQFPRRRRSTLGRRNLIGERPLPRASNFPTLAVPLSSGLRRLRSAKKNTPSQFGSGGFRAKRLFNNSPYDSTPRSETQERVPGSSAVTASGGSDNNSLLDCTGIRSIQTPSPDNSLAATKSFAKKSTILDDVLKSLDHTSQYQYKTDLKKFPVSNEYVDLNNLKPPKSPGTYRYDKLMMEEFSKLTRPVDPEDEIKVKLQNISIGCESQSSSNSAVKTNFKENISKADSLRISETFSPHLSSTCFLSPCSQRKSSVNVFSTQKYTGSARKLSVINEDLDSTDTFLMDEKTILEQDETIINNETTLDSFHVKTDNNKNSFKMPLVENNRSYVSDESDDYKKRLTLIDEHLNELSLMKKEFSEEMEKLKKIAIEKIDSMIKKTAALKVATQNMEKCKKFKSVENKENVPTTVSKVLKNKWIDELKMQNPGLLKTPKLDRSTFSLADQSSIWTPHSLSSVLHDQADELFD